MIPQVYFDKVKKHFNGDQNRTWEWFKSIHPAFGMLSPLNAIKLGRENKVQGYIDKKIHEKKPL